MGCTESDKDIIEQILAGRQDLYAILVNKYKQRMYGLLRGMGATHEDAQDIAQEAFIKAYASWRIMIEAEASRHGYIPLLFVPIRIDSNASSLQWSNGNKKNQPTFSFNIFKHKKNRVRHTPCRIAWCCLTRFYISDYNICSFIHYLYTT